MLHRPNEQWDIELTTLIKENNWRIVVATDRPVSIETSVLREIIAAWTHLMEQMWMLWDGPFRCILETRPIYGIAQLHLSITEKTMSKGNLAEGGKTLVGFAAVLEAITGLALIIAPVLVVRALFGADISGVSLPLGRLGGISLLAFGLACWPLEGLSRAAFRAMFTYNILAAAYLGFIWVNNEWIGRLLIPVVAIHCLFVALFIRIWIRSK
jgi:hypothetical protein